MKIQIEATVPLKDTDILGIGKYKFTSLQNVPSAYLITLRNSLKSGTPLALYIDQNMERLQAEANGEAKQQIADTCNKWSYDKEGAERALNDIAKDERPHKKPCRAYLCPKCGLYHLTSKPGTQNDIPRTTKGA